MVLTVLLMQQVGSGRMEVNAEDWWPRWCPLLAGRSYQSLSLPVALCLLIRKHWWKHTQTMTVLCKRVRKDKSSTWHAGFGVVCYPGFALEGVSTVELIEKVRGLLERYISSSDRSGWRCHWKKTEAQSAFIACSCLYLYQYILQVWLVNNKMFTCLFLGLLFGSSWLGLGRRCGLSRVLCSTGWSWKWCGNLLARFQLLL